MCRLTLVCYRHWLLSELSHPDSEGLSHFLVDATWRTAPPPRRGGCVASLSPGGGRTNLPLFLFLSASHSRPRRRQVCTRVFHHGAGSLDPGATNWAAR